MRQYRRGKYMGRFVNPDNSAFENIIEQYEKF